MTDANNRMPVQSGRRFRFGTFEVDFSERELRNRGIRVNLQRKPFQILELLLRKPGGLVTREELARYLWPDLHVSFSHGLNTAINTLRQALGDSPGAPRYIETRSGLGYRFIAPVEEIGEPKPAPVQTRSEARKRYEAQRELYQSYLKGKYLLSKCTRTELGKSIVQFESAIAQDRRYALAYTGLGEAYVTFASLGLLAIGDAREKATEATRKAIELDAELAEGYAVRARIRQLFERDYESAEADYRRALALNPGFVEGYLGYASLLAATGRRAEAVNRVRSAQDLDALSLALHAETAWIYYMVRRFEDCANQSWQALILEAQFAPAQHTLGLAYEQMGSHEEAVTELHNAVLCSEAQVAIIAGLGHASARSGRRPEAESLLGKLAELGREQIVSAYWRSILYTGLGANDLAIASLKQAVEDGDPWVTWLNAEPRFDPLRGSPAFENLLEKAGFRNPSEMPGSEWAACGTKQSN